ncbi:MerR family transcriptional regulator [Erythrobacter aurantius]|uniref:MerR family transcriptional regulator n=1 Tax=Erythrobacter aurantius TaxID=2909249 RepID=UPI002079356B|nr:MerR family transcriptional regulator [Erythrobacter aurantius]
MADNPNPAAKLYTRADLVALAGVDDAVLPFWFREGLLIPEPAEARKHRRFNEGEAKIAALLGEARTLGLNISALRALATQVRRGLVYHAAHFARFADTSLEDLYDAVGEDGGPRELFWVAGCVVDGEGGVGLSVDESGDWLVRAMPDQLDMVARAEVVFDLKRILSPFGGAQ